MMPIVHAIFAYALSYFSGSYAFFTIIGSILPDIDTLFTRYPEMHRTFFHTPAAGIAASIVLFYLVRNRKIAASFLMGWFSHLTIDTLTVTGVMWKYPFSEQYFSTAMFRSADIASNFIIIFASCFAIVFAVLFSRKKMNVLKKYIRSMENKHDSGALVVLFSIIMLGLALFLIPSAGEFPKIENSILISKLLEQSDVYDGKYVTVAGSIKEITENFTSRGAIFQIFVLNDGTGSIRVYKSEFVRPGIISPGDGLVASGLFSMDRGFPELRITPSVGIIKSG